MLKSNRALLLLQVTLKLFVSRLVTNYCRKQFGSENWFCDKGTGLILLSENNFKNYSKKFFPGLQVLKQFGKPLVPIKEKVMKDYNILM